MKSEYALSRCLLAALLVIGVLPGCGGDDDDEDDGGASVTRVSADPSIVARGQGTIVSVEFSFSSDDVFDDDRDVGLVVRLPRELGYRAGTSEIKRAIDDRGVNPSSVTVCPDGTTYVGYSFDESELTDASNPDGDADAELRFTADTVSAVSGATIVAAARMDGIPFSCTTGVATQASGSVTVQ